MSGEPIHSALAVAHRGAVSVTLCADDPGRDLLAEMAPAVALEVAERLIRAARAAMSEATEGAHA